MGFILLISIAYYKSSDKEKISFFVANLIIK